MGKQFKPQTEVEKPKEKTKDQTCTAFGCSIFGSLSNSTNGTDSFCCRYHFGTDSRDWGGITTRVRQRANDLATLDNMVRNDPHNHNNDEFRRELVAYIRGGVEARPRQAPGALKSILRDLSSRMSLEKAIR